MDLSIKSINKANMWSKVYMLC